LRTVSMISQVPLLFSGKKSKSPALNSMGTPF
jgi:hypothetical protein